MADFRNRSDVELRTGDARVVDGGSEEGRVARLFQAVPPLRPKQPLLFLLQQPDDGVPLLLLPPRQPGQGSNLLLQQLHLGLGRRVRARGQRRRQRLRRQVVADADGRLLNGHWFGRSKSFDQRPA